MALPGRFSGLWSRNALYGDQVSMVSSDKTLPERLHASHDLHPSLHRQAEHREPAPGAEHLGRSGRSRAPQAGKCEVTMGLETPKQQNRRTPLGRSGEVRGQLSSSIRFCHPKPQRAEPDRLVGTPGEDEGIRLLAGWLLQFGDGALGQCRNGRLAVLGPGHSGGTNGQIDVCPPEVEDVRLAQTRVIPDHDQRGQPTPSGIHHPCGRRDALDLFGPQLTLRVGRLWLPLDVSGREEKGPHDQAQPAGELADTAKL